MLKQIFETVPVSYWTTTNFPGGWLTGMYPCNVAPYMENLHYLQALFTYPMPTQSGETSIYLLSADNINAWPSWAIHARQYDSVTGQFLGRLEIADNIGTIIIQKAFKSRLNHLFWINGWQDIYEFNLETLNGVPGGQTIDRTHFEGSPILHEIGLDETADTFLNGSFRTLSIYEYSTGALRFTIALPDNIAALCLEDDHHAYVLCGNRMVLLMDYMRGRVLGAGRIPPTSDGLAYWNNNDVRVAWDETYKRLLVVEKTPNNADGSSTIKVRGYRMVAQPDRLTPPLPLKAPRKGRIVPFLMQTLDDMNLGTGGYIATVQVTGDGSLVGVPASDAAGRIRAQVYCTDEGEVAINCTVTTPEDIVIDTPTLPPAPENPGDPDSGLPATAPNMMHVLQQVYNSQTWRLGEIYEDEPDGRGAFTGAVVDVLHAQDGRWGHVRKDPGQNQYNGHAVDAINFRCDDGVTAEIYDIVSGGVTEGGLCWRFVDRSTDNFSRWTY